MFSRKVQENNFIGAIGNELFPRINADQFNDDWSLLTVLRALLGNRTEDEVVGLFRRTANPEVLWQMPDDIHGLTVIDIHDYDADDAMKVVREAMEKLDGFHALKDLEVFTKDKGGVSALFCISEEKKQAYAFVCDLNLTKLHFIESFIPRLLPWYFTDNPIARKGVGAVDAEAYGLIKACTERDPVNFDKAVAALYSRYDFRDAIIRAKLAGFEKSFHKSQLSNVKNQIERTRRELRSLEDNFRALYSRLDEQTTQEAGLIEKIKSGDSEDSEIRDLFLVSKNLHLREVDGARIQFIVATTINNYDPEIFERTIENERSFWYRTEGGGRYSRDWSDDQIEKFFKAVFADEILKIKTVASYELDFGTGRFAGLSGYTYGHEFDDFMPNQHIHQYGCLGSGHESQLREAMLTRNYLGAVQVCIASAGNMSMQEVPTGEHHMKYLLSDHAGKCIILPDGSEVTPKEALKWLEENEKEDVA